MSGKVEIAKIGVTVNGGEYSVESFKMTISVNSAPTVTVGVLRRGDMVRRPGSEEVIAAIRERQQRRLAGLIAPDVTIAADDGMGGRIDFVGFMTAPVVEISTVSVVDSFTALGVDGMLDALDLSIYRAGYKPNRAEESIYGDADAVQLKPIPAADSGAVTGLISEVSKVLYDNYQASLDKEPHPSTKKLVEQQHTLNSGLPVNLWLRILSNSGVNYESWAVAAKKSPGLGQTIALRIMQMLTQKGGGFWNTLNGLMASFQMFYVPSTTASGKLVRGDAKVAEVTGQLELSVTSVNVSDGSHRIIPVGGVVMMRPTSDTARPESSFAPGTDSVSAQYPPDLLRGYIHREMPPIWLINANGSPVLGTDIAKAPPKNINLNIPAYVQRRDGSAEKKVEMDTEAGNVMTELCRVMFEEMQLAHSTAVVSIPLNFKVNVGERVTVKILSGGSFTAFVNSVIHSVDLRQGKELNSFTQVSFTHVRY